MDDLDARLRERLTAYRNGVVTQVAGPGPDRARYLLRRRRRMTAVAVVATAVALVVAPIVANAALRGDQNQPALAASVEPTAPPTSAPPTPTPTPTPAATTDAPKPPDGRISRAQLLAAHVDLPSWPSGPAEGGCATSKVRLRTSTTQTFVSELADDAFQYGDLDDDGAVETVAVVACRYGEASAKQVVAFDRDPDGRIVTVGRVVRTGDGFDDIRAVEIKGNGSVEVRVADIVPCCGTPTYLRREQVRTYRWDGERFDQTDGPTSFGKDPRLTDLRLSMTHERTEVPGSVARRKLTIVLTVTNAGPVDAPQIAIRGFDLETSGADWSKCDPTHAAETNNRACLLPGVPAGESRRYTFVQLVPSKTGADAQTRGFWVAHHDAQDREWPDLNREDNSVDLPFKL
ncbi:hypothetical protein AB0C15_23200 [Micromonospora sp. NPDC048835]|uniref:hypothetical protein n=1 Tax=Micromonospora sp. NPDC048835 TaxID=3155147 RepID=UPI003401A990